MTFRHLTDDIFPEHRHTMLIKTIFHQKTNKNYIAKKEESQQNKEKQKRPDPASNNTLDGLLRWCGVWLWIPVNGNWLGRNRWRCHEEIAAGGCGWLRCRCSLGRRTDDGLEVENAAEATTARVWCARASRLILTGAVHYAVHRAAHHRSSAHEWRPNQAGSGSRRPIYVCSELSSSQKITRRPVQGKN